MWKPLPRNRILKTLRESPKRTISASGGPRLLHPYFVRHTDEQNVVEIRSPFTRKGYNYKPSYGDSSFQESDISYVSSGRPSIDRIFPSVYDSLDMGGRATPPRMSSSTDLDLTQSFESLPMGRLSMDMNFPSEFSSISQDSDRLSISSQSLVSFEPHYCLWFHSFDAIKLCFI